MCAIGVHGVQLVLDLDKQHLATFDALDFCFLLLPILQINAGQVLELEFGRHVADASGEGGLGNNCLEAPAGCCSDGDWR